MIISVGKSRHDTRWRAVELTWSELCDRLARVQRTHETMREYRAMSREEQGRVKDIGGFVGGRLNGGRRCKAAVLDRCLVTLDADRAAGDTWDDVRMLWEGALCCYSTHSHGANGTRLRFVIPLKRAVTPDEYPAVARKLASRIGLEFMDASTYDVSRLMYWPSCPIDAVPVFGVVDGEFIDPDEVLAEYGPGDAWKDSTLWPIAAEEDEIVQSAGARQGLPEEKPGIVGMFCRAYDIPAAIDKFLPDVYEPCGDNRYTYMAGSTSGGAVMYDEGRFLYSHHGTDPCGGQLVNAFDLVRIHMFGGMDDGKEDADITQRPSYKKMCEFAAASDGVKLAEAEAIQHSLEDMFGEEAADSCADVEADWAKRLTKDRRGATEPTLDNIQLILLNDKYLRGTFGLNRMRGDIMRRKPCVWGNKELHDPLNGDLWTDADDVYLRAYLERWWHIDNKEKILSALTAAANKAAFDPVMDYLRGLKWDGVERLDTMLVRWMGAEDTPYVRAATRKWMCGAVKRALEPGCKFDSLLVLTGGQGIGKSELGRQLSKGWFSDSLNKLDNDKDSQDAVRGVWIVELAELASLRKGEMESIKNFTSKQVDEFRPAYARCKVSCPRRCVFYGTTNDKSFLRDRTGNRRFWPVEVQGVGRGEKVYAELGAEVDQLWAEAVVRYKAGERLFMDGELAAMAEEAQNEHTEVGEFEMLREQIIEILEKPLPEDWESRDELQQHAYYEQVHGVNDLGREPGGTVKRTKVLVSELVYFVYGERLGRGRDCRAAAVCRVLDSMPEWKKSGSPIRGYKPFKTGAGYYLKGSIPDDD